MTATEIARASRTSREAILAFGEAHGFVFRGRTGIGKPKVSAPVFDRAQERPRVADDFQLEDELAGWSAS